jgi:putative membrane protein
MPAIVAALLLWAHPAFAHVAEEHSAASLPWNFDATVTSCLIVSLALYLLGLRRLWNKAGMWSGIGKPRVAAFLTGWFALAGALVTPLDALGGYLFSAHMVQHEILMVVAAPLLVLGKPLAVWAWALPRSVNVTLAGSGRNAMLMSCWRLITLAPVAWGVHAVALWLWHAPRLFDAALASESVHTMQHLSFFLSALLFWWAAVGEAPRLSRGAALFYLFTTMMHTTILGALLTVSSKVWYTAYGDQPSRMGFDALEDQQLGGLIMWVPGGLAFLLAGLIIAWQVLARTTPYKPARTSLADTVK